MGYQKAGMIDNQMRRFLVEYKNSKHVKDLRFIYVPNQITYEFSAELYLPTGLRNMVHGDQIREEIFHITLLASITFPFITAQICYHCTLKLGTA